MPRRLLSMLALLGACAGKASEPVDTDAEIDTDVDTDIDTDTDTGTDADADGFTVEAGDCDDADPAINPGALEVCDDADVDEDCDGLADDADASATGQTGGAIDGDGDGYAGIGAEAESCDHPALGGDCEDADAAVHPAASEVCGNGLDDDCDGARLCRSDAFLSSRGTTFWGDAVGLQAGSAVAGVGDVDADGYADLLVGAPSLGAGTAGVGAAYLVLGSSAPASTSLSAADATFSDEAAAYSAGTSVAGAGDVDGDGYDDMLIGADANRRIDGAGAAYLILGSAAPSSTSLATAAAKFAGIAELDGAGHSVAGAGDVDDDGYDDMLVGAAGRGTGDESYSETYLILGSGDPSSMSLAEADAAYATPTQMFPSIDVAGAGDVDADGHDDLLIGTFFSAYLVLGSDAPTSTPLASAGVEFTDGAGVMWVAGAGDVNADGYADLLIGEDGAAYLLLGSNAPASRSLSLADATFGEGSATDGGACPVAATCDVDRDGFDDLFIGAWRQSEDGTLAGAAYVILGSATPASISLADADATFAGHAYDYAGVSLAGVSDFDGDGHDDLLVGASHQSDEADEAGAAYLIRQLAP